MTEKFKFSRRGFLKSTTMGVVGAVSTVGAASIPTILTGCSQKESQKKVFDVEILTIPDKAPDGKALKAGLIGCGGRGTGAVVDMMNAASGVELVAIADIFQDKIDACRSNLEKKGIKLADDKCYIGLDGYKKVIDSDIDIVLLCTPPYFRPEHFAYAVEKGKHCFIEKPCAVDAVGARSMLITSKKAEAKGLSVVNGIVRRYQKDVRATLEQVANGAIGEITSGHSVRLGGSLWEKRRQKEWADGEYVFRNWPNFTWLSGDMTTENTIHEIDLMNLFMGNKAPISASATGGRARRGSGNVYDYVSVEYTFENGIRSHAMARQINNCGNEHRVTVYGTKGYTDCFCTIYNYDGTIKWQYQYPDGAPGDGWKGIGEGYVLEHVRLIQAIREGKQVNDTAEHVQATLLGIIAREAAYTGKIITWQEISSADDKLGPKEVTLGKMSEPIDEQAPLPGTAVV